MVTLLSSWLTLTFIIVLYLTLYFPLFSFTQNRIHLKLFHYGIFKEATGFRCVGFSLIALLKCEVTLHTNILYFWDFLLNVAVNFVHIR